MAANASSSNPFRRKSPTAIGASTDLPSSTQVVQIPQPQLPQQLPSIYTTTDAPTVVSKNTTKRVKKVRVQSPPPSSPESTPITYNSSTSYEAALEAFPEIGQDPFDHDEGSAPTKLGGGIDVADNSAPRHNPFARTLASLENTVDDTSISPQANVQGGTNAGKGSMDVEAFKRLLMTGIPETMPQASLDRSTPAVTATVYDGSSSATDLSSVSKHSALDSMHDYQQESPRTSQEVSDIDDDRRRLRADSQSSMSDRKKPPPPNSRHGKLLKMDMKQNADAVPLDMSESRSPSYQLYIAPSSPNRSSQDLNKPLPEAPIRLSLDSDHESVFDREAAGKTPEPASPPTISQRRGPPAPPARRPAPRTQDSASSGRLPGRLSPNMEESDIETNEGRDDTSAVGLTTIPPPPPARRPPTSRTASRTATIPSPDTPSELSEPSKTTLAPMAPPVRTSTTRPPGRPPSVSSMDLSSKRGSGVPPPPPPPRQRASSRASMDSTALSPGSGRVSGEYFRRSIDSARRSSASSQVIGADTNEAAPMGGANDIMADITALQREIDVLRGQAEKRSAS